jgi:hypothetical protein
MVFSVPQYAYFEVLLGEKMFSSEKKQLRKNKTTHAQFDPPRSTLVIAIAPAPQISHVISKLFVTSAHF